MEQLLRGGHTDGSYVLAWIGVAMSWVKIDDRIFLNLKFRRASDAARLMYFSGLCFSAQAESDGAILAADLVVIGAHARVGDTSPVVAELVALGLWDIRDGGYQVHDYLQYQPSRASLGAVRQRKKAWISAHRNQQTETVDATVDGLQGRPVDAAVDGPVDATVETPRSRSPSGSGSQKEFFPVSGAKCRAAKPAYSEAFNAAWRLYGRKEEKPRAFFEWLVQARSMPGGEAELLDKVQAALAWQSPLWAPEGWKYAVYFERYLKRRRWEDERRAPPPGKPVPRCMPVVNP